MRVGTMTSGRAEPPRASGFRDLHQDPWRKRDKLSFRQGDLIGKALIELRYISHGCSAVICSMPKLDQRRLCLAIDVAHDLDLMATFQQIRLIYRQITELTPKSDFSY